MNSVAYCADTRFNHTAQYAVAIAPYGLNAKQLYIAFTK